MNKKDFEVLFWIEYMNYNTPELLSKKLDINEKEAENKLNEFKEKGLIKLEIRDNKIYNSILTEKGLKIWNNKNYEKLKEELGY